MFVYSRCVYVCVCVLSCCAMSGGALLALRCVTCRAAGCGADCLFSFSLVVRLVCVASLLGQFVRASRKIVTPYFTLHPS